MNREQVIRMAREAEMEANESPKAVKALGHSVPLLWLERFAALVAAAERRKHQADIEHWKAQSAQAEKWRGMAHARHCDSQKVVQEIQREAMELERDACAQLVSDTKEWRGKNWFSTLCPKTKEAIAAAIRARGGQPKD